MRIGPVTLAWADPAAPAEPVPLSAADQRRIAGFAPGRARAFLAGRALLARLVAEVAPEASDWEVTTGACVACGGAHGPAVVQGAAVRVSLAHAEGLVVAAAAPASALGRLGVDAEREPIEPAAARELADYLGGDPATVVQRWTAFEAALKADGRGVLLAPDAVRLSRCRAVIAEGGSLRLRDVSGPPGYRITLAWGRRGPSPGQRPA